MLDFYQENINALKKRNIRLIFIIGPTGVGKSVQCIKLQQELKLSHISTGDLIREEIKLKTKIGQSCADYVNKGHLVPQEFVLTLLLKTLVNTKGTIFLIDGFPRTLDQALFIEKNLKEIKMILYLSCDRDILQKRLINSNSSYDEEMANSLLNEFEKYSTPLIDFYNRFGLIKEINSNENINSINKMAKEALLPEIYCMIGKRYSGKSTFANAMISKVNIKYINFAQFLKEQEISKRINDDDFVINSFIDRLRQEESTKVLIEDFPLKENYYKLFVKNAKPIKKVYYLKTEDSIANERMMKLGKDHPSYIGCSKLKTELDDFKINNPMSFLSKIKDLVLEVDVNNYFDLDFNDFICTIKPYILLLKGDETELKQEIENKFVIDEKFTIIDVDKSIQETILRENDIGKNLKKQSEEYMPFSQELVFECLKPIIFKEGLSKIILKYNNLDYKQVSD